MIGYVQAGTSLTLIDNTTRNGSFEVFTGTGSPNALIGDVTDWIYWAGDAAQIGSTPFLPISDLPNNVLRDTPQKANS